MITPSQTATPDGCEVSYRDLINNFSGVIYTTDITGTIRFVSPGVTHLTGYTPEEVAGRNFSFLVDPPFLSTVYQHYGGQIKSATRETTLEFRTLTREGRRKWVEQIAVLLVADGQPTGFQCFVRDISEKVMLRQELETFEHRFEENRLLLQSILDNASSLIYVKDLSGRYLVANRRFLEIMGRSEEEIVGETDYAFCSKEQADRYKTVDDQVLRTGQSTVVEETVGTKNGLMHLLLTKFPLRDPGNRIVGISGIATDITERARYQEALISARNEAEDARRMQEQFLANMSHEIRTPMNGIQGMTHLLLETPLNPQQQEFVDIIHRSVDNLLVIINDILDFSKIKAGKLSIESIDFRLADVMAGIKALFTQRIGNKGLAFDMEIGQDIPEWLQGDPHRLTQVFINLVGNAIKFTDKGTIRVRAALESNSAGNSTIAFTVEDEGIGISPKHLPNIFNSFSQAGPDIARKYGGTGLGLAICDRLLSLQGGSIEVSSSEGKGTAFCFRLPFGSHPAAGQAAGQEPSIGNYEGFLRDLNVLVVEDNLINQKVTDHVLRKAGARVSLADNGEEAVRLLESDTFDLIIMDLHMPVMDGYETTRHLREVLGLRTPVLAMTASALNGEQLRCLQTGMNDYMSKPFEFREFYHRVARLISGSAGASRPSTTNSSTSCFDLSLLQEVGDEDYVQGILQTFARTLPDQLAALQSATRSGDFERIHFIAHRLKGSAGMLQAAKLSDRLSRVEQLAGAKAEVAGVVDEVTSLLEDLLGHLHPLIEPRGV